MSFHELFDSVLPSGSDTKGLATLSLAVAVGIAIGNFRIFGVKLGVAAVLFSALLFAQMGLSIDSIVVEYLRDFALVLFIYSIGLQMGPGFTSSLRDQGLRLNAVAIVVIVLGSDHGRPDRQVCRIAARICGGLVHRRICDDAGAGGGTGSDQTTGRRARI